MDDGQFYDVTQLERDWLAAETAADQARAAAIRAERAAVELTRIADRKGNEITVLLGQAEKLSAWREEAEKKASEAFDRLWRAKDLGQHARD